MKKQRIVILLSIVVLAATAVPVLATELTVYSARKEHLVKPLFEAYEKESGTKIRYLTGKAPALLQRLPVLARGAPHRFVKPASFAMIVGHTVFAPHHAGLLPDTGVPIFGMCVFQMS